MGIKYLHTMVRVKDLEASMAFYRLLGLEETRRYDNEGASDTPSNDTYRGPSPESEPETSSFHALLVTSG